MAGISGMEDEDNLAAPADDAPAAQADAMDTADAGDSSKKSASSLAPFELPWYFDCTPSSESLTGWKNIAL
jgi:hypothetical protein